MKQNHPRFARAALLLATAALPFIPLAAQDTQPAPPPPATQQPPVDVPAPPAPAATPAPAERPAPAPAPQALAPTTQATAAPRAAPVRVVRTPSRAAPAPRAVTVAPAPLPAAVSSSMASPVAATTTVPPATVSPTAPPEPIAAAPASGVDTVPPPAPTRQQPTLDQRTATWPWFLLGALLLGAAALLFARRRRARTDVYEDSYAPVHEVAPQQAAVAPPAEMLPAAVATAPEPQGEPEIALLMRPHRAGVAGDDARVQFELTVDNRGSAPARDLRVSTWMLAAASSKAEQALIEPREAADTPPLTIDAGEARTMEAEVALPRSEIEGDALLPVVVADARYVLSDGREVHATARFAVGVPNGEELAWFDLEHPSGLHEGVVAQALGEAERS